MVIKGGNIINTFCFGQTTILSERVEKSLVFPIVMVMMSVLSMDWYFAESNFKNLIT